MKLFTLNIFVSFAFILFSCKTKINSNQIALPPHVTSPDKNIEGNSCKINLANNQQWLALKKNTKVDDFSMIDDKVFCGETACDAIPMKDSDASSFLVCSGSKYAKDKNFVYYPLQIACIDKPNCGVCFCEKYIVQDACPGSFVYLGKDYAKDEHHVFFQGINIPGADPIDFTIVSSTENTSFGKDAEHFFSGISKIEQFHPSSIKIDFSHPKTDTLNQQLVFTDGKSYWLLNFPDQVTEIQNNK